MFALDDVPEAYHVKVLVSLAFARKYGESQRCRGSIDHAFDLLSPPESLHGMPFEHCVAAVAPFHTLSFARLLHLIEKSIAAMPLLPSVTVHGKQRNWDVSPSIHGELENDVHK
jgi:hypothetical protein